MYASLCLRTASPSVQINDEGNVLLDSYARPQRSVANYRTQWSGIRAEDLIAAPSFNSVRREVAALLRGRVVVGHSLHSDFQVMSSAVLFAGFARAHRKF